MCLVAPARVLSVDPVAGSAEVVLDGAVRRASVALLSDVAAGDQVLVAAGTVIRRLEPAEAAELIALLALARPAPDVASRRDLP